MEKDCTAMLKKLMEGQNRLFEAQQQLHHKFDSMVSQLKNEVDELKKENENLKKDLQQVTLRLDRQEQQSRSKNIVFYGIPGSAGEKRIETETKVAKIVKALNVDYKVVVAHRLSAGSDGPIVAVFESRAHAHEMLNIIRESSLTISDIGLKGHEGTAIKEKKIFARPHLCPALAQLQKAASALKTEANWGWTKVITSKMEVQIYKGRDRDGKLLPPVTVRSPQDVLRLRLQMVEQGILPEISPTDNGAENHAGKKRGWADASVPGTNTKHKEKRIA